MDVEDNNKAGIEYASDFTANQFGQQVEPFVRIEAPRQKPPLIRFLQKIKRFVWDSWHKWITFGGIALIIGAIVAVNLSHRPDYSDLRDEYSEPYSKSYSEFLEEVAQRLSEATDDELEEVVEDFLADTDDKATRADIRILYATELMNRDKDDEALAQLNSIEYYDLRCINDRYRHYYSAYINYYDKIGDMDREEEMVLRLEYYLTQCEEIINDIYN